MEKCKNVFEQILKYGHDEEWLPDVSQKFDATDAPAGSPEKIEVLRKRLELGLPARSPVVLWFPSVWSWQPPSSKTIFVYNKYMAQ